MDEVSFEVSKEQFELIKKIAVRAEKDIFNKYQIPQTILDTRMDLCALIAQGCQLDLEALLNYDAFNFAHDIGGIYKYINRDTGKLERCFLPRCSRGSV